MIMFNLNQFFQKKHLDWVSVKDKVEETRILIQNLKISAGSFEKKFKQNIG